MYYKLFTHKYIKLFFAFILFLLSYLFIIIKDKIYIRILFIIFGLIILFFFIKNEFLIISFLSIKNGKINDARKWINYIKYPNHQLLKRELSYFFFLKGLININSDLNKSEYYFLNALKLGLKFKYNKAIAKLNLATIYLSKGKKIEAENLLLEVKKIDKFGIMREQIKFISNQIKKVNIVNNLGNPNIRKKVSFIKKN